MNNKLSYCFWFLPIVAVSSLGLDIFIPGLPQISDTFGTSPDSTQLLISIYVFALSIGQLIFGLLIDKYGCQKAFILGVVLFTAANVAIVYSDSYTTLLASRFIQGLGGGAIAVSIFSSVPKNFNKDLIGKVFSVFSSVLSIVPVLAPILGGFLTATYSWTACFTFLTAYMIFCMILNCFKPLPSRDSVSSETTNIGFQFYLTLLRTKSFVVGCTACSLGFSTQLVFFSSSPIVIIKQFQIDTEYFGFLFAVNAFSITLGSLLVVKLIGKYSEEIIIKAGAILLIVAGVSFYLNYFTADTNVWYFIMPSCFGSFGFALLMSAGTTLALSEFAHQSGRASSINGALPLIMASIFSWLVMSLWDERWMTIATFYCLCGFAIYLTATFLKPTDRIVTANTVQSSAS
ncbi:Bcr/CflA subfamily drug resistance transporter [Vibrio splendidus]|uniref:multidrug effflux MFS transporter n=1 Tax=Vibrio splendidus TaxID=29497 RepID=UPI000C83BDC3|nr:multidrug effflux MFS transporter [Vibrio splendidus]PMG37119.1 Bcr/CflA subfamily drug resistance transporter [Vibrio splendidus]